MKLALVLLVLLPVVFSTPQKRLIFDTLFQTDELKTLVDGIVGTVGTDATEQACETECHTLIQTDHLLQFGCPLICKSFQSLVHRFGHVTVAPTSV
uniref:Vdg3 n=1 Tax=Mytilus edulis TaxID=6550 RepID=Q2XPU9_MYTED|nr:vdg3 [Mytilus edulis]